MKVQYRIAIGVLAVLIAAAIFKTLIGGSTVALMMPQGPIAAAEWNYIKTAGLLMLLIAILTLAILYTFAWKYRADRGGSKKRKQATAADLEPNGWGEVALWLVPIAVVAALGGFLWQSAHALDPYRPIPASETVPGAQTLTVDVVALPWKWLFIYPAQNIATVNLLEFPQGTPVHFNLTADGPMSIFWIPQLGTQIAAMAAMQTQLNLTAPNPGQYLGRDTEINGAGYAGMTFTAKSVSPADFAAWVASIKQAASTTDMQAKTLPNPAGPLDAASYAALAAPSSYNPVAYYSSVNNDLFNTIMMKYMMPSSTMESSNTPTSENIPAMQM